MSKGVTMRWVELSAFLAWLTCTVLAISDTRDGQLGIEGMWALLIAAPAMVLTLVAWASRSRDAYQNGLDQGLAAAGVIKLRDHEHI